MKKNADFNDDLINTENEPIIIHQSGGSDKKFIYTILILLVMLFIIALAAIFYLGTKFFNSTPNSATLNNTTKIAKSFQEPNEPTLEETNAIENRVAKVAKKDETAKKVEKKDEQNDDIAQLESILNEAKKENKKAQSVKKEEKIEKAVANATGGVKLSPEDIKKIAQMVAMQLKESNKAMQKQKANGEKAKKPANEEEALVQSLQAAATDTLNEEKVDVTNVKNSDKKINKTNKKVDTYNKVVVANSNNEDEFTKLSQEIDAILNTEEVQKKTKKAKKRLEAVVKERKRAMRYIVVKPGDTLSSIAYRAYGRASAYVKIYKANPDLVKDPNKIYVGMKLRVPLDEEYKGNIK